MQSRVAALYGLLHDIGKVLQRALEEDRSVKKLNEFLQKTYGCYEELGKAIKSSNRLYDHDVLSICFIATMLNEKPADVANIMVEHIHKYVAYADEFAAAERGLEVDRFTKDLADKMFKALENSFRSRGFVYSIHRTPMLSPLWLAHVAGYSRGPCEPRTIDLTKSIAKTELARKLSALYEGRVDVVDDIAEEIVKLVDEKLWFPIKPLSNEIVKNLEAYTYLDAQKRSSYIEVLKDFIEGFTKLLKIYPSSSILSKGFLETLCRIIEKSLVFVPAAIYGTIAPDTSLAMHSRTVASIAEAVSLSKADRFHVLSIDFVGIQPFVSTIMRTKLASKVLRGRSLLLELIQRALTHYVAELFDVTPINVLIEEGGSPKYIVPALPDINKRIEKLRKVLDTVSHHELNGELRFSVAISKPITREHAKFLRSLVKEDVESFAKILEDVAIRTAVEKHRAYHLSKDLFRVVAKPRYDHLLQSFVSEEDPFDVDIDSDEKKRYLDRIAPETFELGEFLSGYMHRVIALGYIARNLTALIEVYMYRDSDGVAEPAANAVIELTKSIASELGGKPYQLVLEPVEIGERFRIALIPLQNIGALFIAISSTDILVEESKEFRLRLWSFIKSFAENVLRKHLESLRRKIGENLRIYVRFVSVNDIDNFVPSESIDMGSNIDVGYGYFFTNTYFFVKALKSREEMYPYLFRPASVEELEIPLLGLTKIDGDAMGSILSLIGRSPTRVATLSMLLSLVFGAKMYLKLLERASKAYSECRAGYASDEDIVKCFEEKQPKVAILYAGGDDVVAFGDWIEVLEFARDIVEEVDKALKPLKVSVGISFDRVEAPIASIYSTAIEYMNMAKNAGGASIRLPAQSYKRCSDHEFVDVLTYEELCKLVEMLKNLDKTLSKGLLYSLTKISRRSLDIALGNIPAKDVELEKARIYIDYVYLWVRRHDELIEIVQKLNLTNMIPIVRENSVPRIDEVIEKLAAAYPFLAYAYLKLRL